MTDFNVTEAMDLLHDYANQLNVLHDEMGEIYDAYDFVPNSMSLKIDNDTRELNDLVNPVADNLKAYFLSSRHGGARKGAGRKKEAPTKQIRIDADLAEPFKALSDLYRSQSSDTEKFHIIETIALLSSSKTRSEAL